MNYLQRFQRALEIITGYYPNTVLCQQWLDHTNDDLQAWVLSCCGDDWMQGIVVIEAAMILADQPKEGLQGEICYKRPTAIEMKEEIESLRLENERLINNLESAENDIEVLKAHIEQLELDQE